MRKGITAMKKEKTLKRPARIHTTKSYISKIENGVLTPSVSTFYKIIEALGFRVEIVNSIL